MTSADFPPTDAPGKDLPTVERRSGERVLCPPGITVRAMDGTHVALVNASVGGLLIHAVAGYHNGETHAFQVSAPGHAFTIQTRVVHIRGKRGPHTFTQIVGLAFTEPLSDDEQRTFGII